MKKREENYDLLRIVACIAVIMIHTSAAWFNFAAKQIAAIGDTNISIDGIIATCIYNAVSRFAVPCFVMLSGAFILDNPATEDWRNFYAKSFKKIFVPAIIFSVLYIIYGLLLNFTGEDEKTVGLINLVKHVILGEPFYHMWYLSMLIGVYIMAPFVYKFKSLFKFSTFYKITIIFLFWASISSWTSKGVRLHWDLGQSFEYLGYFMIGFCIREKYKNNQKTQNAGV